MAKSKTKPAAATEKKVNVDKPATMLEVLKAEIAALEEGDKVNMIILGKKLEKCGKGML